MTDLRIFRRWCLALAVASAGTLAAQEAPAPAESEAADAVVEAGPESAAEEAFFETVDVNLINVDVFVTDKSGEPILGLTRDDFEVYEDKRQVVISNFYAVEGGRPVREETVDATGKSVVTPAEELPLLPLDEHRLNLIVYIDNYNIRPFNRNRVFRRLREFLHDKLDKDDRVMLVTYDRTLHYRHPFTSDPKLIARALFDIEKMTGHAVHVDSERRDLLRAIEEASVIEDVQWQVRQYSESMYNDLSFSIDALKNLVGTLGGLQGRNALLYVSDGLQMTSGEEMYYALMQRFSNSSVMLGSHDFNAQRMFQQLVAQANSNRVTFYTIDAAGLRVASSGTVERMAVGTAGLDSMIDSVYFSSLQSTLRMMADATGGKAILNTNDIGDDLAELSRDFDTYYSLGYVAGHFGDQRYHSIEVKVKRKGTRVRHREGYRDKSMYTRMSDGTTSALMYGFERNPLDVGLSVGSGKPADRGRFMVPVRVDLPLGKIVLVPQQEAHRGRLRLYFSAVDDEGRMADVTEVPLDITVDSGRLEEALGEIYRYQVDLEMRGGPHRLAVAVRDELGSVESFVTRSFVVGG